MRSIVLPAVLCACGMVAALAEEPAPPKQRLPLAEGLSPKDAAAAMTVPAGFRVQLFAGEPDVKQPIALAIDDRGRVWVAEAYTYPHRAAEGKGQDRILIFEDTDGDGVFDKRTVFIDKLNLVSALEVGFGGVWVGAAPYLLFIPDRDGDDKPDSDPVVLLDGWGHQDTHETLNSFIWGPDGWLYGCHGVFTHSNVGKPGAADSARKRINAGFWRYHPTRHLFDVFAEGTSNPWGLDFNDRGQAFATACVIPHLYHVIQGGRYQRQAGSHFNPHTYDDIKTIARHRHWVGNQWNNADRAKSDAIGGGHAHAGAMIYLGGAWPDCYRNQLFMNNIHGARLNEDRLTTQGSGYSGDAMPDFLFANDAWSQIINLQYGPDGQMYMIDWYDKNQCHHGNAAGHDRTNGRIFRVSYDDAKPVKVDLAKMSDAELVDLQLHKNDWYVRHARRLLQERAAAGKLDTTNLRQLYGMLTPEPNLKKEESVARMLRGFWALHVTGILSGDTRMEFLRHREADVRAWGIQLACEASVPERWFLRRFYEMAAGDSSPVVRLYLASALQRIPLDTRWESEDGPLHTRWDIARALVRHGEDAGDHNLPLMYWYAVEPLVMSDPVGAMELAAIAKIPLISRYIVRRAAAEEAGYDALLAALGTAEPERQRWMLEEIVSALKIRANLAMPKSWFAVYDKLMASDDTAIRRQAEFVAVKLGDRRVLPGLRRILADRDADRERRTWALESLLAGKDAELPPVLHALLDEPSLRTVALTALASYGHEQTPKEILSRYARFGAMEKQSAISALTARPAYVFALLDAIEAKTVPRNDLSAFTVRQLSRFDDAKLNQRLNQVWGTLRTTAADKAAEMDRLLKTLNGKVLKTADLPHGRELFNKTCASCHTLFGTGKTIGPDLTGSNRADLKYLLENILDPSAVVGKDYLMTVIVTKAGRMLSGLVTQENATALTLQTPTEAILITKADIEDRMLSPNSMMPDGLLKELKPDEVRDLIAYLGNPLQVPLPGEGPWLNPRTGRVDGALEGESLKIVSKSAGEARAQDMQIFKDGRWSGDHHLWWTGARPGSRLVLEVSVKDAGKYEVFVAMTRAIDYGIVQWSLNEQKVGVPIDLFNDGVVTTGPISLGVHELKAGTQTLAVEIIGANPRAVKAYMVGLDYVALLRRP